MKNQHLKDLQDSRVQFRKMQIALDQLSEVLLGHWEPVPLKPSDRSKYITECLRLEDIVGSFVKAIDREIAAEQEES